MGQEKRINKTDKKIGTSWIKKWKKTGFVLTCLDDNARLNHELGPVKKRLNGNWCLLPSDYTIIKFIPSVP